MFLELTYVFKNGTVGRKVFVTFCEIEEWIQENKENLKEVCHDVIE